MIPRAAAGCLLGLAGAWPGTGLAAVFPQTDPAGDARVRRTDFGADGPLLPHATLPDAVSLLVTGWTPNSPAVDPYTGAVNTSAIPDLLRLELVFAGLVNPPGPLGIAALPFDPVRFGPSPVYGFIEFDLDQNADSGGEPTSVASTRPLANLARFGSLPAVPASLAERFVTGPWQTDFSFLSSPQFERTGAELSLAMCGCWEVEVLDEGGEPDGAFDAGDTWIVRGRFLERAQGFTCASFTSPDGNEGPSGFGLYDPVTEARFSHNVATDRTSLEIVFPVTPAGAAQLTGTPVQPLDFTFGSGNHFCLEEALTDLTLGADFAFGQCDTFVDDWDDIELRPPPGSAVRPLDPSTWTSLAIFGTSYAAWEPGALYVWTDAGFMEVPGDLSGNGVRGPEDFSIVESTIASLDGGFFDNDPAPGSVLLHNHAKDFSLADLDGDGRINTNDLALARPCRADIALPFGQLTQADILAAVSGGSSGIDFDLNGTRDVYDVLIFLEWFAAGCP